MLDSQNCNDTSVKDCVAVAEQGSSAAVSKKNCTAVTSVKQKWHEPSRRARDEAEYSEGLNISFSSKQRRERLKPDSVHQPSSTTLSSGPLLADYDFRNSLV